MEQQTAIRVLLIEDNPDFAKLVDVFLRKHEPDQFLVTWKENGASATELDETLRIMILMDYFLPGQNGLEITRLLHDKQGPRDSNCLSDCEQGF
ncbi:MAG: hypothetical protein KF749_13765 [Bacteroidetes bacterium]|nr:hypothetical protein [Bacteroidota bacterium]